MTDRELLELAAKAAGYSVYWHHADECFHVETGRSDRKWKPLDDDGDALRLAVKLGMTLVITNELGVTDARIPDKTGWLKEQHWDNTGCATRRAIVRTASATK